MWLSFFACFLACLAFLYVPGVISLLFVGGKKCPGYLLLAPLISVFELEFLCILYPYLSISATSISLLFGFIILSFIFLLIGMVMRSDKPNCNLGIDFRMLLFWVAIGVIVALVFYVVPLDGPSSFNQDHDNVWHLNLIRSFCNSGNLSPLSASVYGDVSASPYGHTGGFYPAAWHAICSSTCMILSAAPAVSANALNSVIIGVVFPSAMYFFSCIVFPDNPRQHFLCAILCLSFAAFPWGFVVFGPLYPNLFGMALLPLFIAALYLLLNTEARMFSPVLIVSLVCGFVSLALAHPNTVFTAYIFAVCMLLNAEARKLKGRSYKIFAMIVTAIICCLFWLFLYKLPFLSAATSFSWPASYGLIDALLAALTFNFTSYSTASVLTILVLIGSVSLIFDESRRWLCACFGICLLFIVISIGSEGSLKHLLTGFWYTDPYRLAANLVIAAIPIAGYGLSQLVGLLEYMTPNRFGFKTASCLLVVVLFLNVFAIIRGEDGSISRSTSLGTVFAQLSDLNNLRVPRLYDAGEQRFVSEVKSIVGDSLVLNMPEDGSFFAYSQADLNVFYRQPGLTDAAGQTEQSHIIKNHLYQISSEKSVKSAVNELGAKYILLLDQGGQITSDRHTYGYYNPDEWLGFNNINDATPGFERVLSEGDMRLYKIVD